MNKAYSQAVKSGRYAEGRGLRGKYDHVRTRWEDAVTARHVAPFVSKLVHHARANARPLRVLELGCGGGDGLGFLQRLPEPTAEFDGCEALCFRPGDIGAYRGLDINEDLLAEAEARFPDVPYASFALGDISKGLPVMDDAPYDIYFTSFGTLSHLHEPETKRLLADISSHAAPGSLLIGDWLGRYSYEWQDEWRRSSDDEQWLDYRISYIYSEQERRERRIESFPLRLVGARDVDTMVADASGGSGTRLAVRKVFDRSILVGRHIETGEYNDNPMPVREAVNSLWEPGLRTDLSLLRTSYHPRQGFDVQNEFFAALVANWNRIVDYALSLWKTGSAVSAGGDEPVASLCRSLDDSMSALEWYEGDDVRADVLEPQLAATLRNLETRMQSGQAVGHGLVGVLEVTKS